MTQQAFELLRQRRIDSIQVEIQEYRHRPTGAVHYHLAAGDNNNCFAVAFPTVPRDSTGVAHILEHTVLCGSRRYPVRDPFFMMLRRSLNTFMNAFTTSDATAYPFATQNRKDFDNLLSVYLDAVFFPRLEELNFAQEGHRIEFERAGDANSPLVFRGVVYNEMKGAMSAPIAQVQMELQSLLFPTTTYHYNAGGDPACIPDLTYAQLKAFHKSHYHPSNAMFMTYGDFPVREHQARFEEWALREFQPGSLQIDRRDEQRYTAPVQAQRYYTHEGGDTRDKTYIALGWLLGRVGDVRQATRDLLLGNLLLMHSASPLRQALETTKLGAAPIELCGVDDSMNEAILICGLEGSNPEHADAVERLVFDVLKNIVNHGMPAEAVEAVLTQMELAQRQMSSNRTPYGLQLLGRVLNAKVHGGDPLAFMDIDQAIEPLREELRDPMFIPRLVRERLLENPHRVRLVMSPDPELAARHQADERKRLAAFKATLSAADQNQIVIRARELDRRQREPADPNILPKVELADVPPDLKIPTGQGLEINGMPLARYVEGTNGLVHLQAIVDLPALTDEEKELVVIFYNLLDEVGSGGRDYLATQALGARIGAQSAYVSVRASVTDPQTLRGYFALAGKSLMRDHGRLAQFMREMLETARFDELKRLREVVSQMRLAQESSITQRGQHLAMLAAASGMGPGGALDNIWDGPVSIQFLKTLDDSLQDTDALKKFAGRMAYVHSLLLAQPCRLLLVSQAEHQDEVTNSLRTTWGGHTVGAAPSVFTHSAVPRRVHEAWVTNTQVNFCARAYPAAPADHPDAPVFSVLGKFLHHGYLHRAIREQGGAYGSGASYDADSASFRFYSYRDPRLEGTLHDFDNALEWLQQGGHTGRQLEEAILGVIQIIDQPKSPAAEAIQAYFHQLQGRTPEFRRRFRQRALNVTLADLQRVGREYLKPAHAGTAVICNQETLKQHRHLDFETHDL
ncbi:MAG TPA: insulinase family protein [Gammaproteobacteria bacterium]|nr:insulinase family protein [Gammaproteobacteria bacterium]